jgi:hypothetical protein
MRSCVLSVSKGHDPQQTVWIFGLEINEGGYCFDAGVVHEGGATRAGFGDETVEIVDGLGKSALILDNRIEKE